MEDDTPEKVGTARLVAFEKKEGVFHVTFEIVCDLTGDKETIVTQVTATDKVKDIDVVYEAFDAVQKQMENMIDGWLNDIKS